MGLEEIVQRIAADADGEAASITEDGRRRAAEAGRDAAAEAAEQGESILSEARERAARHADQRMARARLELGNLVLAAKREALDEVRAAALARLRDMPDADYLELMISQVARRATGHEAVAMDARDADRLGSALVEGANRALAAQGKPAGLTPADQVVDLGGDDGGVLLIGDGTEEPITSAGLVDEACHELEPEVARILFGEMGPDADAAPGERSRAGVSESEPQTRSASRAKQKAGARKR